MSDATHDDEVLQALSAAYTENATETAKRCLEQIVAHFPISVVREAFKRLEAELGCGC
ncbi:MULTISPECIES: hypothetical protein [Pseudomonas]|uniref:Uncharacterized protein n=1 Tax=Pseudomonas lutea TaxID=243924 RepID=A0A9X8MH37_9PSED|nr:MULTISPECIES: hypothetical protein [Pseudomonas]SER36351.1 hypothetical protein SAMN05216409_11848 [Pseudomonas lutea]